MTNTNFKTINDMSVKTINVRDIPVHHAVVYAVETGDTSLIEEFFENELDFVRDAIMRVYKAVLDSDQTPAWKVAQLFIGLHCYVNGLPTDVETWVMPGNEELRDHIAHVLEGIGLTINDLIMSQSPEFARRLFEVAKIDEELINVCCGQLRNMQHHVSMGVRY